MKAHRPDAEATGQLTRELERTRQFSAMVAHEMRNLMAPLVYGAELLGRTDAHDVTMRVRRSILISVANLRRLVDDLLSASACEQGRMTLVKTLVDLRDVVTTSAELVEPMFPTRGQHFNLSVPVDGATCVNGDFCRLTQVVSNLLINAAKFTPDEGDIQVALSRDGKDATVSVKDSGVGIEPQELTRIFEAYTRGADGAEACDGLGLGLTIARRLAEMHGGTLTVSSAGKGAGSEFVLRLPMVVPS